MARTFLSLALGISASAMLASTGLAADPEPAPPPESADFYIAPSVGIMFLDLPEISANAVAVDAFSGTIDLSPDLTETGAVYGLDLGARLGETSAGTLRLRASGFYTDADDSETVDLDGVGFGALAYQGIWGGANQAAAAAAVDFIGNNAAAAGAGAASGNTTAASSSASSNDGPPTTALGTGSGRSDLGSAVALAGNIDDAEIEYESSVEYWGGEVALALDHGFLPTGELITPFVGVIYRNLERDLTTTLSHPELPVDFSVREQLDSESWGVVVGVDTRMPLAERFTGDMSLAVAPMFTDAEYRGHEVNGDIQTNTLRDDDDDVGVLARVSAGVRFHILSNMSLRLGGQFEYMSAVPTIERTLQGAVAATGSPDTSASAAASAGSGANEEQTPLARLGFDSMVAYGLNASLEIAF